MDLGPQRLAPKPSRASAKPVLNGSIGSLAAKSPAEISQLQIRQQPSALARQGSKSQICAALEISGMEATRRNGPKSVAAPWCYAHTLPRMGSRQYSTELRVHVLEGRNLCSEATAADEEAGKPARQRPTASMQIVASLESTGAVARIPARAVTQMGWQAGDRAEYSENAGLGAEWVGCEVLGVGQSATNLSVRLQTGEVVDADVGMNLRSCSAASMDEGTAQYLAAVKASSPDGGRHRAAVAQSLAGKGACHTRLRARLEWPEGSAQPQLQFASAMWPDNLRLALSDPGGDDGDGGATPCGEVLVNTAVAGVGLRAQDSWHDVRAADPAVLKPLGKLRLRLQYAVRPSVGAVAAATSAAAPTPAAKVPETGPAGTRSRTTPAADARRPPALTQEEEEEGEEEEEREEGEEGEEEVEPGLRYLGRAQPWELLGEAERRAARTLGYGAERWAARHSYTPDAAPSPRRRPWDRLSDGQQHAAASLGWCRMSWEGVHGELLRALQHPARRGQQSGGEVVRLPAAEELEASVRRAEPGGVPDGALDVGADVAPTATTTNGSNGGGDALVMAAAAAATTQRPARSKGATQKAAKGGRRSLSRRQRETQEAVAVAQAAALGRQRRRQEEKLAAQQRQRVWIEAEGVRQAEAEQASRARRTHQARRRAARGRRQRQRFRAALEKTEGRCVPLDCLC
jgi:hypothetical protein